MKEKKQYVRPEVKDVKSSALAQITCNSQGNLWDCHLALYCCQWIDVENQSDDYVKCCP